jgi:uncharacterized repeat protein (TIGR03803 family)
MIFVLPAIILITTAPAMAQTSAASIGETVLYGFFGGDSGTQPSGGVVLDRAGNLYGMTVDSGQDNCNPLSACGSVYQLSPPTNSDFWTNTILHTFVGNAGNDGAWPTGGLVMDEAGALYGTTAYGGSGGCVLLGIRGGCGVVFEMSPPSAPGGSWTETILYSFQGGNDGYFPAGNLVFDEAGNLYGATAFGGGFGTCNGFYGFCGTVFELSPPTVSGDPWTERVLYSFKGGTDGANPNGGLVLDKRGDIYGTTYFGGGTAVAAEGGCTAQFAGGTGCGTVFMLSSDRGSRSGWNETILHRFKGRPLDGAAPLAGLAIDEAGNLYGTTSSGGKIGMGTIFKLSPPSEPQGFWVEDVIMSSSWLVATLPETALIFDKAGRLYGTSQGGGLYGTGTAFRLEPPDSTYPAWRAVVVGDFPPIEQVAWPDGQLVLGEDGTLYGTAQVYDSRSWGTAFSIAP